MKVKSILFALFLSSIFIGCKKERQVSLNPDRELVNEALSYFSKFLSKGGMHSNPGFEKRERKGLSKFPVWDKASVVSFRKKPAVIVPVQHNTPVLIQSNFGSKNFYKLADLSKLLIYWDETGKPHGEYLTYFPDGDTKGSFVGILSVETWQNKAIAKYRFEKDGKVLTFKENLKTDAVSARVPGEPGNGGFNNDITICYEASGVNYSDETGEYYVWTESLGCTTYYFPNDDETAGGPGNEGAGGDGGGDGYGNYGGEAVPVELFSTEGPAEPVNIAHELGCFDINNQSSYYVTVNVNQPIPGTRTKFNPFADRKVGHVFLSLTQLNADNSMINRNVGFYPRDVAKPAIPVDESIFGNDTHTPVTVALTLELSAAEFQSVKQSLINAANNDYDLNNFNCVDVVVMALERIYIFLPRTVGTMNAPITIPGGPDILFQGLNPADLGEDIRHLNESTFGQQNGGRFAYIERYNGNSLRRTRDGICP